MNQQESAPDQCAAPPPEDPAIPAQSEQPSQARPGLVGLLTAGHALNDFYATMISPILVELGRLYGLSIAGTQMLPMWTSLFGSVVQPFAGIIGDRVGKKVMIAGGSAAAALFICSLGYASSFTWLVCLLVLGSLGVSVFHPNAASATTLLSTRRSLSFAVFLAGGTIGLALSPLVVTGLVKHPRDLPQLVWLCIPGLIIAILFAICLPGRRSEQRTSAAGFHELIGPGTGLLWFLFVIVTLRSVVFTTFFNFMGHLCEERGWTIHQRGVALSCLLASSGVAGMVQGWFAHLINRRLMVAVSCLVGAALLAAVSFSTYYPTAIALLLASGLALGCATPMLVVVAQDLCPGNQSAASGMMMGLAWGVAGLTLPLIGKVAEIKSVGPSGALLGVSLLAALAGVLAVFLPNLAKPGRQE